MRANILVISAVTQLATGAFAPAKYLGGGGEADPKDTDCPSYFPCSLERGNESRRLRLDMLESPMDHQSRVFMQAVPLENEEVLSPTNEWSVVKLVVIMFLFLIFLVLSAINCWLMRCEHQARTSTGGRRAPQPNQDPEAQELPPVSSQPMEKFLYPTKAQMKVLYPSSKICKDDDAVRRLEERNDRPIGDYAPEMELPTARSLRTEMELQSQALQEETPDHCVLPESGMDYPMEYNIPPPVATSSPNPRWTSNNMYYYPSGDYTYGRPQGL